MLHSHNVPSPLSDQAGMEVSCFGNDGNGDAGDDWIVDLPARTGFWKRGEPVRFKHSQTKVHINAQLWLLLGGEREREREN
jgi:dolichyl-phosphate-mannose--protein O-mannosyl transferase